MSVHHLFVTVRESSQMIATHTHPRYTLRYRYYKYYGPSSRRQPDARKNRALRLVSAQSEHSGKGGIQYCSTTAHGYSAVEYSTCTLQYRHSTVLYSTVQWHCVHRAAIIINGRPCRRPHTQAARTSHHKAGPCRRPSSPEPAAAPRPCAAVQPSFVAG